MAGAVLPSRIGRFVSESREAAALQFLSLPAHSATLGFQYAWHSPADCLDASMKHGFKHRLSLPLQRPIDARFAPPSAAALLRFAADASAAAHAQADAVACVFAIHVRCCLLAVRLYPSLRGRL